MRMIESRGLDVRYGKFRALQEMDLRVEEGETYGLLGPNGAGKTTVMKVLSTLLPPTSGTVLVAGHDVVKEGRKVQESIGYVPQLLSADGSLTGYENMMIFAKLFGLSRRQRINDVQAALEYMGLADSQDQMVKNYSGGMVRRLEIAQSLLHHPPVLLMDEPTTGLDPVARETVWRRISALRQDRGTTILITTHLMEEAEALCDRVGILDRGRMVVEGSPCSIIASSGCSDLNQAFHRARPACGR
jgi:ABC-2 type transport system ATP-binding protein